MYTYNKAAKTAMAGIMAMGKETKGA